MCDKNVFGMEFMDDYYVFFFFFPLKDDAQGSVPSLACSWLNLFLVNTLHPSVVEETIDSWLALLTARHHGYFIIIIVRDFMISINSKITVEKLSRKLEILMKKKTLKKYEIIKISMTF